MPESRRPARMLLCILALGSFGVFASLAQVTQESDRPQRPQLSIVHAGGHCVVRYVLPEATGALTLYKSLGLSVRPRWAVSQIEEIPVDLCGELSLPLAPSTALFQLGLNTNPVPKRMVWIPPGTFAMGSKEDEAERTDDEGPCHEVSVTNGFWLCNFEVTQAEYLTLIGANPSEGKGGPNAPVERVSWFDATNYCGRLSQRERALGRLPDGLVYRLPSEAEWEYACRAQTQSAYSYGDNPAQLSNYGWWAANAGNYAHAVGQKQSNPWGLYDMHGNVFEWCADWYLPYPGAQSFAAINRRVVRGGSRYCPSRLLRSACRNHSDAPETVSDLIGFRVALGRALDPAP